VVKLGLAFDHGSGAKRLSLPQQQRLALARALVKRPDLLIVNRALSALDSDAQDSIIARVLEFARGPGGNPAIYWVLNSPGSTELFDRVLSFENGHLVKSEAKAAEPEIDERPARVA
jgi:putative ABC transport system ATP-binding protein